MKSISEFKGEDGRIDWKAFEEYEISCGYRCYECKSYAGVSHTERRRRCYECNLMHGDKKEEVVHEKLMRCPHCAHVQPVDSESVDLYREEANQHCQECEEGFTVGVEVKLSYRSYPVENNNTKGSDDEQL